MGIVYCAHDTDLERKVAVKVMAPEHASTEDARRRFIRESRAAAALDHPNIVTIYRAGQIEGQLFIAMKFIDGCDLRTLRQSEHILPPDRLLWILEQVAAALDAAHEAGLVHRDVKPGNVLVDKDKAYLTDFGLTKSSRFTADSSVTGEGRFVGTVHYSAPEQITGSDVDYRADVYSLGAVVYECLTGDVPYPKPDSMTTALAHISDPVPKVTAKRPDLPPAVDDVIAKALSKDREDRYQSCRELYEAVAAALADAPSAVPGAAKKAKRKQPSDPEARTAAEGAASRSRIAALTSLGEDGKRWPLLAVVGVLVAVIAGIVLITSGGGSSPEHAKAAPSTHPVTSPAPAPKPAAKPAFIAHRTVRVGRRPFGLTAGHGGIWVTNFDQDAIRRVDPTTGDVTGERIPVGDGPFTVASAKGMLWIALNHADAVERVDPTTSTAYRTPIKTCDGPSGIRGAGAYVWVACENDDTLARIDPITGVVVGRTHVGDLPRGVTATRGVVWVANRRDGTISRVNNTTGQPIGAPIRVGGDPHFMTVANGMVWVTNNDDDAVTRINAKTGRVVGHPIHVGHAPWGIAYGLGSVWVANSASNTVSRIDARTGKVKGDAIRVGRQPSGVVTAAGAVWVTDNNESGLTRITPAKKPS
jgi:YVTN family beta-propeller protein